MTVGSFTNSFLASNNSSSVRTPKEDMSVVSVMLINLAMELDQGDLDIVPMFETFGQSLKDLRVGVAG